MKVFRFLKKSINVLTLILCSFILYNCCLYNNNIPKITSIIKNPLIIYILCTLVIISFIIICFRLIDKLNLKQQKLIKIILFLLLVFIQIIFIANFNVAQVTDSYFAVDQAISIANGTDKTIDYEFYSYFNNISNNNPLMLMIIFLVKFLKLFSIDNYILGLTIANTILIDISIFFIYKSAKEIKNEKFALKTLMINILNPLNYVFIFWLYTPTFSMPFMTLILYLTLLIKKNNNITSNKSIILLMLLMIASLIGGMVRATTLIATIASMIYLAFSLKFEKKEIKKYLLIFILIITMTFSMFKVLNYAISQFATDTSKSFPFTHFIMIGMNEEGRISSSDIEYTSSFETKEEKIRANIEKINEKFEEYGFSGYIHNLYKKLAVTWQDGMSNFKPRMYQNNTYTNMYSWIVGPKSEIFAVYCQSFRIFSFLFMIFGIIYTIKNDRKHDGIFLFVITILGTILFYLIWESKSDYNIQVISILLLITSFGIDQFINNKKFTSIIKKNKYKIIMPIIGFTVLYAIIFYKPLTKDTYTWTEYNVLSTNTSPLVYIDDLYTTDSKIIQEFYVSSDYNYIQISAEKNSDSPAGYNILVKDSNGKVVKDVIAYKQHVKNSYVTINLDDVKIDSSKYFIEISRSEKNYNEDYKDSIKWGYIKSKNLDTYNGKMFINDERHNGDMFIRVYNRTDDIFMNSNTYIMLFTFIFVFDTLIIIADNKETRK